MKLSRRLIPAIAMLMVSAVLMSTASFAWFSMNDEVTATGISVTAQAPTASLLISQSQNTDYVSAIALTNENTSLTGNILPAADLNNNGTISFYKLNGDAEAGVDGDDGSFSVKVGDEGFENHFVASNDYFKETFYLKLDAAESATAKPVSVTATWAANTGNQVIRDAIHVLLVVGTTVVELDMGAAVTNEEDGVTSVTAALANIGATAQLVTVYVFLDGEDADCVNKNITTNLKANIDLAFTITQ